MNTQSIASGLLFGRKTESVRRVEPIITQPQGLPQADFPACGTQNATRNRRKGGPDWLGEHRGTESG